jgi:hypothetical protein
VFYSVWGILLFTIGIEGAPLLVVECCLRGRLISNGRTEKASSNKSANGILSHGHKLYSSSSLSISVLPISSVVRSMMTESGSIVGCLGRVMSPCSALVVARTGKRLLLEY